MNILIYSLIISFIIYSVYNVVSSYFVYIWIFTFLGLWLLLRKKQAQHNLEEFKINCKQNSTCNITENNYNQFPNSLKKLAKNSAEIYNSVDNVKCKECIIYNNCETSSCNFYSYPQYTTTTPNIPNNTLLNDNKPICNAKKNIQFEY